MPAPVYSALLWQQTSFSSLATGPGPDPGFVWVVRDIVVEQLGSSFQAGSGFRLSSTSGSVIWGWASYDMQGGRSYQWTGRHVMVAAEQLVAQAALPGVNFAINGYNLTTP